MNRLRCLISLCAKWQMKLPYESFHLPNIHRSEVTELGNHRKLDFYVGDSASAEAEVAV